MYTHKTLIELERKAHNCAMCVLNPKSVSFMCVADGMTCGLSIVYYITVVFRKSSDWSYHGCLCCPHLHLLCRVRYRRVAHVALCGQVRQRDVAPPARGIPQAHDCMGMRRVFVFLCGGGWLLPNLAERPRMPAYVAVVAYGGLSPPTGYSCPIWYLWLVRKAYTLAFFRGCPRTYQRHVSTPCAQHGDDRGATTQCARHQLIWWEC